MLIIRSFLLAIASALLGIGTVHAQPPRYPQEVAVVSRTCLWNADKAIWSRLGLKKEQVRQMQAIRERYPAVVDGQWILDYSDEAALPDGAGAAGHGLASEATSIPQPQGLQAEIRAVLTPRQVNKWMGLCNRVVTR